MPAFYVSVFHFMHRELLEVVLVNFECQSLLSRPVLDSSTSHF